LEEVLAAREQFDDKRGALPVAGGDRPRLTAAFQVRPA
jgi:hypothetical protein